MGVQNIVYKYAVKARRRIIADDIQYRHSIYLEHELINMLRLFLTIYNYEWILNFYLSMCKVKTGPKYVGKFR